MKTAQVPDGRKPIDPSHWTLEEEVLATDYDHDDGHARTDGADGADCARGVSRDRDPSS